MKLLRIHVENFGKLQDLRLELSPNLHTLHAENGWGKSTLAVFIKAMLYGFPATRARSLDENERKKYTPWQGGAYGGSLEFETAKGKFRVERFFGSKESEDTVKVYDLATNRPTGCYPEPLGEALFGIDADGFERTVYLSQRQLQKSDNNSITAKLADLLDDVDDIGSYDDAAIALDKRRQYYVLKGGKGRIADLEAELSVAKRELESLAATQVALEQEEHEGKEEGERIRDIKTDLRGIRNDLQAAGLAREKQAHLGEKRRREAELEKLREAQSTLDAQLCGKHPTNEQLNAWQNALQAWQNAVSVKNSIPKEPVRVGALECLPATHIESCPDGKNLGQMATAAKRLEVIESREETLRASMGEGNARRFANGIPEEARIREATAVYEKSKESAANASALSEKRDAAPKGKLCLWALLLSVACIAGGIFLWPFFIGVAIFGILTVVLTLASYKKAKALHEDLERQIEEARAASEKGREAVCRFLSAYGYRSDAADLSPVLMRLSIDASHAREALQGNAGRQRELAELREEKPKHESFLRSAFPLFGLSMPPVEACRDVIEALRRDIERLQSARTSEQKRRKTLVDAETRVKECEGTLSSLRTTYDPVGTLSYAACLSAVREHETEYRRLGREIGEKAKALAEFLREKHLDGASDVPLLDYDLLSARESVLQKELDVLQKRYTARLGRISELAGETERIPELEAHIAVLEETLSEARANSATIANTQKYLEEAKTALSTRYLSGMQQSFTRFLSVLTQDTPPEAVMDPSFAVSLRGGGKTRTMESFSRGWRDAVTFCTRLSLVEALYEGDEKPFLLLDDPFVNLDDTRLSAARRLLETLSREYQIIYMVCHADRR